MLLSLLSETLVYSFLRYKNKNQFLKKLGSVLLVGKR